MTETVKLTSAGFNESSSPISKEKAVDLVSKAVEAAHNEKEAVNNIVSQLSKVSSMHKFLVNLSVIKNEGESDISSLKIKSLMGSVWEGKKDGYYTIKLEHEETIHLVQLVWIYYGN